MRKIFIFVSFVILLMGADRAFAAYTIDRRVSSSGNREIWEYEYDCTSPGSLIGCGKWYFYLKCTGNGTTSRVSPEIVPGSRYWTQATADWTNNKFLWAYCGVSITGGCPFGSSGVGTIGSCCVGNGCAASTCSGSSCWDGCQWQAGTKNCCVGNGCASNTCIGSTCWDGCQWQAGTKYCCVGNGCAASTCSGSSCWDGCQWQAGTKTCCVPNCGCAANTCIGSTCPNGCGGFCAGTKTCCVGDGCAASTCIGSSCWDGCQWQAGKKLPSYGAPACFFADTGQTCGSSNCGTVIDIKTAHCLEIDSNGCTVPNVVANSFCGASCQNQTTDCPACSSSNWKEVAP